MICNHHRRNQNLNQEKYDVIVRFIINIINFEIFQKFQDRELFHISLDLKWIWTILTDKNSWKQVLQKFFSIFSTTFNVAQKPFNIQAHAKEISIEILSDIRNKNIGSTIKFFSGTLPQAQQYSIKKNKFLILYIENNNNNKIESSYKNIFRKILGDNILGNLINEQFVFFGGSTAHPSTNKIIKALGKIYI